MNSLYYFKYDFNSSLIIPSRLYIFIKAIENYSTSYAVKLKYSK